MTISSSREAPLCPRSRSQVTFRDRPGRRGRDGRAGRAQVWGPALWAPAPARTGLSPPRAPVRVPVGMGAGARGADAPYTFSAPRSGPAVCGARGQARVGWGTRPGRREDRAGEWRGQKSRSCADIGPPRPPLLPLCFRSGTRGDKGGRLLPGQGPTWGRGGLSVVRRAPAAWAPGAREGGGLKTGARCQPGSPAAVCGYPLVTIKTKCPSAAIVSVWPICF